MPKTVDNVPPSDEDPGAHVLGPNGLFPRHLGASYILPRRKKPYTLNDETPEPYTMQIRLRCEGFIWVAAKEHKLNEITLVPYDPSIDVIVTQFRSRNSNRDSQKGPNLESFQLPWQ